MGGFCFAVDRVCKDRLGNRPIFVAQRKCNVLRIAKEKCRFIDIDEIKGIACRLRNGNVWLHG